MPLIRELRAALPSTDVLIVDDASPDGTGSLAAGMAARDSRVNVLHRNGKSGLGPAYVAGFRRALDQGYELIISMDADFSHDPKALPGLVEAIADHDVVIGSRYVEGGSTPDWTLSRRLISRFANGVARTTLRVRVRDCTSAYRCYRREALEALDLESIKVVGYCFLIETIRQFCAAGLRIREVPITFIDRRVGNSKLTGTILAEAAGYMLQHAVKASPSRRRG